MHDLAICVERAAQIANEMAAHLQKMEEKLDDNMISGMKQEEADFAWDVINMSNMPTCRTCMS